MKLTDWMDIKGYSFRNLADEAGVAVSVIEYIAYGKTKSPHPKTMRAISQVLGVELTQIDEFAQSIEARRGKESPDPESKPVGANNTTRSVDALLVVPS